MGKDPAHIVGRGFTSPSYFTLDSARHAIVDRMVLQNRTTLSL